MGELDELRGVQLDAVVPSVARVLLLLLFLELQNLEVVVDIESLVWLGKHMQSVGLIDTQKPLLLLEKVFEDLDTLERVLVVVHGKHIREGLLL